jgi:hypothetical protein
VTFIGKKKSADESGDEKLKPMKGLTGWPVSISYFKVNADEEDTPSYQISMLLFENGVAGDMKLNYGDFVLNAELADLEMLDGGKCD